MSAFSLVGICEPRDGLTARAPRNDARDNDTRGQTTWHCLVAHRNKSIFMIVDNQLHLVDENCLLKMTPVGAQSFYRSELLRSS